MNRSLFDDAAPHDGGARANNLHFHHESIRLRLTPPANRNAPHGTSDVAARRIAGSAPNLRARILANIVACGADGATDDEGEAALGIKPQTYTPRRGELVALGLVADSGRRRNTGSGRPATVWVAVARALGAEGGAA